MRLRRCAIANRLESDELRLYSDVVYYCGQRHREATFQRAVGRAKTHIAHALPHVAAHELSVSDWSELANLGYRP